MKYILSSRKYIKSSFFEYKRWNLNVCLNLLQIGDQKPIEIREIQDNSFPPHILFIVSNQTFPDVQSFLLTEVDLGDILKVVGHRSYDDLLFQSGWVHFSRILSLLVAPDSQIEHNVFIKYVASLEINFLELPPEGNAIYLHSFAFEIRNAPLFYHFLVDQAHDCRIVHESHRP